MLQWWMITGSEGMLGSALQRRLAPAGIPADFMSRSALDITDYAAVAAAVEGHSVLVNCAAYTDVDGAEFAEAEATLLNGHAVGNLAQVCARAGTMLIHISTDQVFHGLPDAMATPYPEDAPTCPVNAYGRSKLTGEWAIRAILPDTGYIVRTAWLYDRIRGFVPRIIEKAREGGDVEVVVDQMGQPTSADDLADQIVQLAQHAHDGSAPAGIYHATSTGGATKYQLACEALKLVGLDPDIIMPVTSARFYGAPRAAYSILGHDKWRSIAMEPIPHWTLGLRQCLQGS